ncbi:MAG: hypothetical protein WC473_03065 [Patescibacteria group bacterium]
MSKSDLINACGLGSEILRIMTDLIHQVKNAGGDERDIRLLKDERILKRVATILARAGRLHKPFRVNSRSYPDGHVDVFFVGLKVKYLSDISSALPEHCRLATCQELRDLWLEYSKELSGESDLKIIGDYCSENGKQEYGMLELDSPDFSYHHLLRVFNEDISKNISDCLFAVVIN